MVAVFGRANNLGISPSHLGNLGQLSLLPYAGQEMSTGQSVVMLCGWGVKAAGDGSFHRPMWINVLVTI